MKSGIIGNCQYSALIEDGNVAWLCWPRFDSSFVFGSILDAERGGEFRVAPASERYTVVQSYVTNTNILRTRFETEQGIFDVLDFAPRFYQHDRFFRPTMLVRILVPIKGNPQVKVTCRPKWDYGNVDLTMSQGSNHLTYAGAPEAIRLTTDISLTHITDERTFSLSQKQYLALTWGRPLEAPLAQTCEDFLSRTTAYWQRWVKHCHLPAMRQSEVVRSALVLKLHQFEDTGGIIAATTTSIPEAPGSSRNWDYRYCWIRDAYFTVNALRRLSQFEELEGFERFLRDLVRASDGKMQPVYSISGQADLHEHEITQLAGYRNHKPVRVGNDAWRQIQHDVYGQALMAMQPLFTDVRFMTGTEVHPTDTVVTLLEAIERTFDSPDAGLWELRGVERIHTFTKLMHWAGARAAAHIAETNGLEDLRVRALRLQASAKEWIDGTWNEDIGSLMPSLGTTDLDAALLLAVNLGFFAPSDPKAARMVATIHQSLGSSRGLVRRYDFDDGMGPATTCFTVCSFWLAEAMARIGEIDKARDIFASVLSHANHVGLLGEDIDTASGELWGNFPQTYSHVGLINAAFAISAEMERQHLLVSQ